MAKVTVKDVHGVASEVEAELLQFKNSIYGIAVRRGANGVAETLIIPQFDGYDWPGGTIDKGEEHLDALVREYKEESGLEATATPGGLISIHTSLFKSPTKGHLQSLLIFYFVDVVGGEISQDGFTEYEKKYSGLAKWMPISELRKMRHACGIDIAGGLLDAAESKASGL